MSTRQDPGPYNCYANLLPDEPYFVLMGRDDSAPSLVQHWAANRTTAIQSGERPGTDVTKIDDAMKTAYAMRNWRIANNGIWRKPRLTSDFEESFTRPRAVPERFGKVSATVGAPPRPNLAPGMWVHYKFGVVYELMHLALNEGTGEWMVIHRNRQTMNIFVRPAREWTEIVQSPDGRQVPRFREPIRDERTD